MEISVNQDKKPEIEAVISLLKEMSEEQQRDIKVFIQGMRFVEKLNASKETA